MPNLTATYDNNDKIASKIFFLNFTIINPFMYLKDFLFLQNRPSALR